jgi:hypothetical protein
MRQLKLYILFAGLMLIFPIKVRAAPGISGLSDNRSGYNNSQIPTYYKLELSFNLTGLTASNYFMPFDPSPPPGVKGTGVSVSAEFLAPNGQTFRQPGFYYQDYQNQLIGSKDWLYPTGNFSWKVRFSPHLPGNWQYRVKVDEASGLAMSNWTGFTVVASSKKGNIRVSPNDYRYFEYSDGTYFPALGYNLNFRSLDWVNPSSNLTNFQIMKQNGIQLTRTWITQWSIYGGASSKWFSPNRAHIRNEPIMGIWHLNDATLGQYPQLTPPPPVPNQEYYMWLNFNEEKSSDGMQWNFTPCRMVGWEASAPVPLNRNTTYRLRLHYSTHGLQGPKVAGKPFGIVLKEAGWLWHETDETKRCYYPGTGTVLAASYNQSQSYPDPQNPGWHYLETTYQSGSKDFMNGFLYISLENLQDPNGTNLGTSSNRSSGGHAFIDKVYMEEVLPGNQYGVNILDRPYMDHHYYINQRDAKALDMVMELAEQNEVYLKPVILEKNDPIFQTIGFDGQPVAVKSDSYFYGNNRQITKVRWLQMAWWRYLQARWGYSPNIHSWELLNEGNPGNTNHWALADELGKYMKCRVFGEQPVYDPNKGDVCQYQHPNAHMVTTSFWGSFPWHFWNNTAKLYADADYADVHRYVNEGTDATFYDAAQNTLDTSLLYRGSGTGLTMKPIVRGEIGWTFTGTDLFNTNVSNGLWLHNFIWGGINAGGLIEQYWVGAPTRDHIYKSGSHDHRPKFGNYYRFIKDIPLSNGNYNSITPLNLHPGLRALGQFDGVNGRAHVWVQNLQHTWKNVLDGVSITPISHTLTLTDLPPNRDLKVETWNTSTGAITNTTMIKTSASGNLAIPITNLTTDVAFKIGDYSVGPTPTTAPIKFGDIDQDGDVDYADYSLLLKGFGSSYNLFQFNGVVSNFGK